MTSGTRGRIALALALAAVCGLAACGKKLQPPTAPREIVWTPPGVTLQPPARAQWVPIDSPIQARFDVPLDTSSIRPTSLYLKIDTRRYGFRYVVDDSLRRITLIPTDPLILGATYTVEITPRVLRANGEPLYPEGWFWQFTVTSIRALRNPLPANASALQSPYIRLRWNQTEVSAGVVVFQLFLSTNRDSVTYRQAPALAVPTARYIPTSRWRMDRLNYWAVRAINQATGQVEEGPTWSFQTVAANARVDSVVMPAGAWGSSSASSPSPRCDPTSLLVGPTTSAAIRWNLPSQVLRLSTVRWYFTGSPLWTQGTTQQLRATQAPWNACQVVYGSDPRPTGPVLATSARGKDLGYLMTGEPLVSHLEAAMRDRDLPGYYLTSSTDIAINLYNPFDPTLGAMVLTYFR